MRAAGTLFLVIVALATAAGCAGAVGSSTVDGGSASAPAIPDCRNSGVYNRATGLCVSPGP